MRKPILFLLILCTFLSLPLQAQQPQEIEEILQAKAAEATSLSIQPMSLTGTSRHEIQVGTQNKNFTFTHTQNTTTTTNAYQGRSTNDVFYRLTLSYPMTVEISHCGSEVSDTYVHLLDANFNRIAYNDDSSGINGCSNRLQSYLKQENLAKGTYYIVSEGYSQNGNITTTIKGTMPAPTIIDLGSKSAAFTYTHTQNTNNTKNAYGSYNTNDIYYKVTLTKPLRLEVSHCRSEVSSTLAVLLDANFTPVTKVYGATNNCSIKNQDYLTVLYLNPGTYYVVSKGKTENGNITTSIKGLAAPITVDVGNQSRPFIYSNTQNTANSVDVYNTPGKDIVYKITLTKRMGLEISNCGSAVADTYLSVLDYALFRIASNDDHVGTGACANTKHAYLSLPELSPGVYHIISENKGGGRKHYHQYQRNFASSYRCGCRFSIKNVFLSEHLSSVGQCL